VFSRQHVDWGTFILKEGDQVRIHLVDVGLDNVDAPTNKWPADEDSKKPGAGSA
jgi:hypothetical protein